jgi:hypothetical protein
VGQWLIATTWRDDDGKLHVKPLRELGEFESDRDCDARIQELRLQPAWATAELRPIQFH